MQLFNWIRDNLLSSKPNGDPLSARMIEVSKGELENR